MSDMNQQINDKDVTIKVARYLGWSVYWDRLRNGWIVDEPDRTTTNMGSGHSARSIWELLWETKLPHYSMDLNEAWPLIPRTPMAKSLVVEAISCGCDADEIALVISTAYVKYMETEHPLPPYTMNHTR